MEERALRYTGDLHRFNGDCRAVYNGGGRDVTKSLSWREKRATIRVHTPTASYKTRDDDEGVVDEAFGRFFDRGVCVERDSTDIDVATEERLKDLGYM
jgi:hypothetical protein